MNYELNLINSIVSTGDIESCIDQGVEHVFAEYADVWSFILQFNSEYGQIPSKDVIKTNFKSFEFYNADSPIQFYIDDAKRQSLGRGVRTTLFKASESLKGGDDPAKILTLIQSDSAKLMRDSGRLKDSNIADYSERVEILRDRIENPDNKIVGVPSGIKVIDVHFGGFQPGDFVVVIGWTGTGKMVTPATPIPTPDGWRKAGDISPGDKIFGRSGAPITVTHIWPWSDLSMYKIVFNDGSEIEVGEDHIWTLLSANNRYRGLSENFINKTTGELFSEGVRFGARNTGNSKSQYKYYLPATGPVEYPKVDLPIDPYTLGALLGDGYLSRRRVELSGNDNFIQDKVQGANPHKKFRFYTKTDNHCACTNYGVSFREDLTSLGLINHKSRDKFIPDSYLISDIDSRKALLAGLLDTDGSATPRERAKYSSYSAKLAEGVKELVLSLGGVASVKGNVRGDGTEYTVSVWTPFNPFTLPRKVELYSPTYEWFRAIESIERIDDGDGVCFTVDAPDHLYMAGDYIVTHNSSLTRLMAANAWRAGHVPLIISLEMDRIQEEFRMDTILNAGRVFTNTQLTNGKGLDLDEYTGWAEDMFDGKHPMHLVTSDGIETADQHFVQSKIEQYKPDLVILDYHTLFDDSSGGRSETERAKNLSKAFKRMAVRNRVPIIDVSGVTMDDGHDERPPELNEIAWSKQLSYDADMVLSLHRPEGSDIFQVVTKKTRRCAPFAFYLRWNLDSGEWREIYEYQI